MFKMTSFSLNACLESNTPVFHCTIHNALIEQTPFFNKTLLKMINISYPVSIHEFLQDAPDLTVHWIEVWTIRRPMQWCDEVWRWTLQELHSLSSSMRWCAILLENEKLSRDFSDCWQEMLCQQDVSTNIDLINRRRYNIIISSPAISRTLSAY
jgi:hypothetical protein